MSEPIPVRVTRYRCPHCSRSHSGRSGCVKHMGRCWWNPDARGCKTCKHYEPAEDHYCDAPHGCGACGFTPESCAVGESLAGRPACERCEGGGMIVVGLDAGGGVTECQECGGDGHEIKPGPIVGCHEWEAADVDA